MPHDGPHARVVVVGSTNADLLARVAAHPAPGETILGERLDVLPGGKGANQAVAAARLGSPTALVGAVGDDAFAEPALAGLREAGVDLSALAVRTGRTGVALVSVSADGENSIVVIPGVNATVDADAVRAHHDVIGRAAVVVLQGEIPRAGIEEAARAARGRLVVNLAPVIDVDTEVLLAADPLVVNEHEAALVAHALGAADGSGNGAAAPAAEDGSDEAVVTALLARGVPSVVMTLGARGALVGAGDLLEQVPTPRVDAVDTTGAGDAFVGALAHGLAGGDDLVTAARLAARVGAYAVRSVGAQSSYPGLGDELPEVTA
nr:ribokinase [Isoptericola halotolerans]